MQRALIHAVVFATTLISVQAQEPQGEGLNRETVEHLLRVVSPTCREGMQEALSEQTELSASCKEEIQAALRERDASSNNIPPPGANLAPVVDNRDNTAIWLILLFIIVLVGGLFWFCAMVNAEKNKVNKPSDKKNKGKKWAKKNAQKKQQKQQNRQ